MADRTGRNRERDANPSVVTNRPARAGTRPAAVPKETPMTQQRHFADEDPVTTHARLSAAALAAHANACAVADAFLAAGMSPEPEEMPSELKLAGKGDERVAVIGAGTPDERQFSSHESLRVYVRRCVVINLTVRREAWTLPGQQDSRIEPDSARLLLRPGNPVVDIVAEIGMDRSLHAPQLRYDDSRKGMQRFDHDAHELADSGVQYVASLFTA